MTISFDTVVERHVIAGTVISVATMAAILWIPSMLGVLHDGYGLDTSQLSRVAAAEKAGVLIGTILASNKNIVELRRWAVVGCVMLVIANCMLLLFGAQLSFVMMRLFAGLGSGVGYAYALKLCSASARPTRSFGILSSLMSLTMIIGYQLVAFLIDAFGMRNGAIHSDSIRGVAGMLYGTFAVLAVLAIVVLLVNRASSPHEQHATAVQSRGMPPPLVLLGLLAIVVSTMAYASIWPFLQTLGRAHGFSIAGVANAMSVNAMMGVVGSLVAASLSAEIRRWVAMSIALVVLWGGLYAIYSPVSLAWYIAGCAIGGFYWSFIIPLMLGLLARIDRTGRGSVLGGTMSSVGATLGPLITGLVVRDSNYDPVGWIVATLCGAGLVCVMVLENRAHRRIVWAN